MRGFRCPGTPRPGRSLSHTRPKDGDHDKPAPEPEFGQIVRARVHERALRLNSMRELRRRNRQQACPHRKKACGRAFAVFPGTKPGRSLRLNGPKDLDYETQAPERHSRPALQARANVGNASIRCASLTLLQSAARPPRLKNLRRFVFEVFADTKTLPFSAPQQAQRTSSVKNHIQNPTPGPVFVRERASAELRNDMCHPRRCRRRQVSQTAKKLLTRCFGVSPGTKPGPMSARQLDGAIA